MFKEPIGRTLGLYWGYIGIMEMQITRKGYIGFRGLGFGVWGLGLT